MAGAFQMEYRFGKNAKVVLKHKKGKFLRIDTNNQGSLDENGGTGKWGQWQIEFDGEKDGLKVVKLKHSVSGKYLRIHNKNVIDCGGGGGPWTRFKLHKTGSNTAKLESVSLPGKYPAVQPKGVAIGGGGEWTEFSFYREGNPEFAGPGNQEKRSGQKSGGDYIHSYFFNKPRRVVLCGFFGKYLRVKPGNVAEPGPNGGTGEYSQFNVEFDGQEDGFKVVRLQSSKTNKYLRIMNGIFDADGGRGKYTRFKAKHTNGNSFKFESCEYKAKSLAVQPHGCTVGGVGKYTEFSVWSNTSDQEY